MDKHDVSALIDAITDLHRALESGTLIQALDEHAAAVRDLCRLLREQREWQPVVLTATTPADFKPLLTDGELQSLEAQHGQQLAPDLGPGWKELPPHYGKPYDSLLDLMEGEEGGGQ